jgi:sugar lactone lactonase YvrE
MDQPICVAKRENILGEGPCWDPATGRLWWLDIKDRLIEWLRPATGESGAFRLDLRASALAPRRDGSFLLATEAGFATFEPETGAVVIRHDPEPHLPGNRSNDGKVDTMGRFWMGTMDDSEQDRSGSLYRLDPDWTVTRVIEGIAIPNTLTCSPDGRTLYVADSKDSALYAYDLDEDTGELGESRLFASTAEDGCAPDGSAMDAEGGLWNAQWGGWRLVRYAPDGRIDRIVDMPVEQPTSCAFGGEDLATLFVTSARVGLSQEQLEKQPDAGSLFAFRPGVKGAPTPPFGG